MIQATVCFGQPHSLNVLNRHQIDTRDLTNSRYTQYVYIANRHQEFNGHQINPVLIPYSTDKTHPKPQAPHFQQHHYVVIGSCNYRNTTLSGGRVWGLSLPPSILYPLTPARIDWRLSAHANAQCPLHSELVLLVVRHVALGVTKIDLIMQVCIVLVQFLRNLQYFLNIICCRFYVWTML